MPARTRYSLDHVLGNAAVQRNIFPRLTGKIRRTDPDGTSLVPYFPALSGTTLNISYTTDVGGVVTPATTSLTFSSNGISDAVNAINALDASNLEAQDLDGFLSIRNKNGGKTHYLKITTGTAEGILGLEHDPYPGSMSVAGEFASSPTNRSQKNPQGTAGLALDETFDSAAINRAIFETADVLARMIRDQDREIVGFMEVPLTVSNFFSLTGFAAIRMTIASATTPRVPTAPFDDIGSPANPGIEKLLSLYRLTDANGDDVVLTSGLVPRITNVLWGNWPSISAVNPNVTFSTYTSLPSTTALSALGTSSSGVTKIPTVTIAEIVGNIIKCGGTPNFVTNGVCPGDYVTISGSTIATPFSHNGDFMVEEVVDNNTLRVRPLTTYDRKPTSNEAPAGLNAGTSGVGSLTVLVGFFLNGPGLIFLTNIPYGQSGEFNALTPLFKIATGVRVKTMSVADIARSATTGIGNLVSKLRATTAPDGAALIGALASGDLTGSATVRAQLDALASGWLKLSRSNTITATQHALGGAAVTSAVLDTIIPSLTSGRKLIWEMSNGTLPAIRLYLNTSSDPVHELVITHNAKWSGTNWVYDSSSTSAVMYSFSNKQFSVLRRAASLTSPWDDSLWGTPMYLTLGADSLFAVLDGALRVGNNRFVGPGAASDNALITGTRYHRSTGAAPINKTRLFDQVATLPAWLASSSPTGIAQRMRIYIGMTNLQTYGTTGGVIEYGDALEIAQNCSWNGTGWTMDDKLFQATVHRFDAYSGYQILTRRPNGPGWSGLSSAVFTDQIVAETVNQSNGANPTGFNASFGLDPSFLTTAGVAPLPAPTTYGKYKIFPSQISLAWGRIELSVPTINSGYGIASVETVGFAIRVHWYQNFQGTGVGSNYVVLAQLQASALGGNYIVFTQTTQPDYVDLYIYNPSTGALVTPSSLTPAFIGLAVWGIRP